MSTTLPRGIVTACSRGSRYCGVGTIHEEHSATLTLMQAHTSARTYCVNIVCAYLKCFEQRSQLATHVSTVHTCATRKCTSVQAALVGHRPHSRSGRMTWM